jgi:hypothetical protein
MDSQRYYEITNGKELEVQEDLETSWKDELSWRRSGPECLTLEEKEEKKKKGKW